MPQYRLRFFRGPAPAGQDRLVDLINDEAAFAMAKKICAAFASEALPDLEMSADLRVDVYAESGRLLFRVAAAIEVFEGLPIRQKPRIVN